MVNPLNVLAVVAVLLSANLAASALQSGTDTSREPSDLREVLLHDAWAHEVRSGPIAIESRVLLFREVGEVIECIYDDTGRHDASGMWALEQSNGSVVLVLSGKGLRDKGRYALTHLPNDDAIELRMEGGERVLQFQRRKGMAGPPASAPH